MMQPLVLLDQGVLQFFLSVRVPPLTEFFLYLTQLGNWPFIFGLSAALALTLLLHGRKFDAVGLAVSVLGSGSSILALKCIFQRPRPEFSAQAYPEIVNLSFPSAHAGLSMALYGFLFYLLLQAPMTKTSRLAEILLPVLVALIGISRLYLGVHYFSDVVVGYIIGFIWVLVGRMFRNRWLPRTV